MKTYIPQKDKFETFEKLIEAATNTYTLSFKGACKALKCSRSWAQTYIRPHVPHIYLSNGKGTNKPNYAKIVSQAVNKKKGKEDAPYSYESIYLHEEEFNKFIISSIVTCQKRSKRIYKSYFISEEDRILYYKTLLSFHMEYDETKYRIEKEKLMYKIETLYLNYNNDPLIKNIIHPAIVKQNKRTEAEFVDVPVPETPIQEWKAVHDLMDYGDIEETIYRKLFSEGCIRVEIKLPDKDGVVKNAGKVYYISDPEPIPENYLSEKEVEELISPYRKCGEETVKKAREKLEYILKTDKMNVKQSAWMEYQKALSEKALY